MLGLNRKVAALDSINFAKVFKVYIILITHYIAWHGQNNSKSPWSQWKQTQTYIGKQLRPRMQNFKYSYAVRWQRSSSICITISMTQAKSLDVRVALIEIVLSRINISEQGGVISRLTLSPPLSTTVAKENSVVPAQTPPLKGGVWAGTLLFSVIFSPCTKNYKYFLFSIFIAF